VKVGSWFNSGLSPRHCHRKYQSPSETTLGTEGPSRTVRGNPKDEERSNWAEKKPSPRSQRHERYAERQWTTKIGGGKKLKVYIRKKPSAEKKTGSTPFSAGPPPIANKRLSTLRVVGEKSPSLKKKKRRGKDRWGGKSSEKPLLGEKKHNVK